MSLFQIKIKQDIFFLLATIFVFNKTVNFGNHKLPYQIDMAILSKHWTVPCNSQTASNHKAGPLILLTVNNHKLQTRKAKITQEHMLAG